MADKRDGDTKQLIAEAEALVGDSSGGESGAKSTREIVSSAERLIQRDAEAPKLSPIPLLIILLVLAAVVVLGVLSAYGTAM